MRFIGIDPGLSGAIVVIDEDRRIIDKTVMPIIKGDKKQYDIQAIDDFFQKHVQAVGREQVFAVLEKAMVIPASGRLSLFSTGFCNGVFQGLLTAHRIPFRVVRAVDWQGTVLKGIGGDTKQASVLWAKRQYPNERWQPTERAQKESDGLCDAAGMAFYAASTFRN